MSIVAIELILKWNKIYGVYSIMSTGQYVPLIIGVGSFISVCWNLMRQESVSIDSLVFAQLLLNDFRSEDVISNVARQPTARMALNLTPYPTRLRTVSVMLSLNPISGSPPTVERYQTVQAPKREGLFLNHRLIFKDHTMNT